MFKTIRQVFSIKTCPTDETALLENTLNSMSKEGWELYSIYESENGSKMVYNCIFVKEVEIQEQEEDFEDISGFKTQMEKMLYSKEQPYELCLNLQKKLREKRERIDEIKHFLDLAKENERELFNEEISKEIEKLNSLKKQLKNLLSPSKMAANLGEERLSINLSQEVYCLNNPKRIKNLLAQTVKTRQDLTNELGYIIPKVQFIENSELDEYEFTINIHSVPVVKAFVYPDCLMYFEDEINLKKYPKNSIRTKDFITGKKIVWIPEVECKDFWAHGVDPCEYIAGYLKYYAVRHVHEIFNYSDMNRYIELVSENNSFLIDGILGEYISVSELKFIFCQLIRERVSVKDVVFIFEKINDFSDDASKSDLLDRIRIALARKICYSLADENGQIFGYEVDENVIRTLEKQLNEPDEEVVRIDGSKFSKFTKALKETSDGRKIVLVAPQHLRQILFVLISQIYLDLPVICLEEISPEFELKILGKI